MYKAYLYLHFFFFFFLRILYLHFKLGICKDIYWYYFLDIKKKFNLVPLY